MSVGSKVNTKNDLKARTHKTSNRLLFMILFGIVVLGYILVGQATPITIDERIQTIEGLGTGYFVVEYPGTFQKVQTTLPAITFSEESDWNEFQQIITVEKNELGFTTIYSHRTEGILWIQAYDFQIFFHQTSV
jgi:hypothetical protein